MIFYFGARKKIGLALEVGGKSHMSDVQAGESIQDFLSVNFFNA